MLSTKIYLCLLALTSQSIHWTTAEPPVNGVRASNILGGAQQHASFSFVRPGLTQTAFAFNGPSSHQAFSSSVGDPHLAHRVQPSLAQALAYRNPGLGFAAYGNGHVATGYAAAGSAAPVYHQPQQYQQLQQPAADYQQYQQALALAYQQQQLIQQQQQQQQQQQYQYLQPQQHAYSGAVDAQQQQQQAQFAQLFASRIASAGQTHSPVPEQIQLQQQEQQQEQSTASLLGVAYSAAPSVAHVKIDGNGYKVDF